MDAPRVLKVFVASPSDVVEERQALGKLVGDINDVLAYLAPERNLRLELLRYETHAYPDIGKPQEVINREMPGDYDIFVGIMWKRVGTATAAAPSGTIEEFNRACERRKRGLLPRIMFYFCEQPVQIPSPAEMEQLAEVVKFRSQLEQQGLTSTYPSHAEFIEHVRGDLLRAIRDILNSEQSELATAPRPENVDAASAEAVLELAKSYDALRRDKPASDERTRLMESLFARMKAEAPRVQGLLSSFQPNSSAGARLAAIAILDMFPQAEHLAWLAGRLDPQSERPFVAYHAAVALLSAVAGLPASDCAKLDAAIRAAREVASRLEGDPARLKVLERAQLELAKKCGGRGQP